MSRHIPLFSFRLGIGQSIGPSALRSLWSSACDCDDVVVSRKTYENSNNPPVHTYTLCGPANANISAIESRLRLLLTEAALTASITPTHRS